MAPHEDPSTSPENQLPGILGPKPRARRPRRRRCLLKGCRRKFRPQQPRARYCSEACRERARQWRAWKTRRRYRQSANGKQKRQAESRRYRERRPRQKEKLPPRAPRGSSLQNFFVLLRPSRVLCGVPAHPTITVAAILFSDLPARSGASSGTRTALASTNTWDGRQRRAGKRPAPCVDKTLPISSGHIAVAAAVSIISTCA